MSGTKSLNRLGASMANTDTHCPAKHQIITCRSIIIFTQAYKTLESRFFVGKYNEFESFKCDVRRRKRGGEDFLSRVSRRRGKQQVFLVVAQTLPGATRDRQTERERESISRR